MLWPDSTVADNVFEAVNWFYADWPYLDNEESNREMAGTVRSYRKIVHN